MGWSLCSVNPLILNHPGPAPFRLFCHSLCALPLAAPQPRFIPDDRDGREPPPHIGGLRGLGGHGDTRGRPGKCSFALRSRSSSRKWRFFVDPLNFATSAEESSRDVRSNTSPGLTEQSLGRAGERSMRNVYFLRNIKTEKATRSDSFGH